MSSTVLAGVNVGARIEYRDFARPSVGADGAVMRIEAAGMCGSDVGNFAKGSHTNCIMGHENVGIIDEISDVAAERWGVAVGDRVLLEEYVPCWHCSWCRRGEFRLCLATDHRQNAGALRFGRTPVSVAPSLWGGYAQYLYVPGSSVVHRIADHVEKHHAALALPLANGVQWGTYETGLEPGGSLVILGPGQQGLGCLVAARSAGASTVIVAGLGADAARLAAARELGATTVVDVESEDLETVVRDVTDGRGVDAVVDTASGTPAVADLAIKLLKRKGGTVVLQGNNKTMGEFPLAAMAGKYATFKVARGHSYRAVERSIQIIAGGEHRLGLIATHLYGLDRLEEALTVSLKDRSAIHVTIDPWL